jgi:hypothetical protein
MDFNLELAAVIVNRRDFRLPDPVHFQGLHACDDFHRIREKVGQGSVLHIACLPIAPERD